MFDFNLEQRSISDRPTIEDMFEDDYMHYPTVIGEFEPNRFDGPLFYSTVLPMLNVRSAGVGEHTVLVVTSTGYPTTSPNLPPANQLEFDNKRVLPTLMALLRIAQGYQ